MRVCHIFLFLLIANYALGQQQQAAYKNQRPVVPGNQVSDWLIHPPTQQASVRKSSDGKELVLYNALLERRFRLQPDLACVSFRNLTSGQELIRAVKPEAMLRINNTDYRAGGLSGQPELAYLQEGWLDTMKAFTGGFHFVSYNTGPIEPFLKEKSPFWMPPMTDTKGIKLNLIFKGDDPSLQGLELQIHYELYNALPLLVKSLTLVNKSKRSIHLNRVVNEILGLVEEESAVVGSVEEMKKQHGLYVETNYAFNNAMRYDISDQTTHWLPDSNYTSQVNYNYQTPCLLEIYPEKGPGIDLAPGEVFHSVRSCELLLDSYDRERRGLANRRMYRTVAPWVTANPIFMHLVSHNDDEVKNAVDQCAATGYEAVILSFGSHLNMEDSSKENIARWKKLAAYAHKHGIGIGGYSLFSSRRISDEDDVIDPATGKPGGAFFGHAPCFGSKWGLAYRDKIKYFFAQTGFDIWENDGPYPGDVCASTSHPGHKGLDDSQWRQMEIQKELYHWLHERGVYINAPDWYFLDGTNKTGLGYREVNFSLPRDQQKVLNRQNIYDGTWEKTPSMGWGFVPLTKYQGGGPEAVLEPLQDHLKDYLQLMFQYYGAGVQACYRGPRLYDTDSTRKAVKGMIDWYKKYRELLNADVIHLRRADGRNWDGWMHVLPGQKNKAMVLLFNPLQKTMHTSIPVPLYYAGIERKAYVREKEGTLRSLTVDAQNNLQLQVQLPPGSYTWYYIEGQ